MWQIPAKTGLPASKTRFDDLVKAHQIQADLVHNDGWFLPFHRLHMHAHERLLREECGYTGAQPYWDEEADAGHFTASELFDPTLGFGGDGTGAEGCIQTGPFANYTLHTGPGFDNTDHCIERYISDTNSEDSATQFVEECLALPTFAEAWPCIQNRPHLGGHNGVGGEMANAISSPGGKIPSTTTELLSKQC
jgi:tyrosinase